MHVARFTLEGITPYSQSKALQTKKGPNETDADHEERCWRERCHTDGKGLIYIPAAALKDALVSAARYLGKKIEGQGSKSYTAKFKSGTMVVDNMPLGVQPDDLPGERLFVNSDGRKGGGKRVHRIYPTIMNWKTNAVVYILDDIITEEVFREVLQVAISMIGFGMHRPENGGFKGRSKVVAFSWDDE